MGWLETPADWRSRLTWTWSLTEFQTVPPAEAWTVPGSGSQSLQSQMEINSLTEKKRMKVQLCCRWSHSYDGCCYLLPKFQVSEKHDLDHLTWFCTARKLTFSLNWVSAHYSGLSLLSERTTLCLPLQWLNRHVFMKVQFCSYDHVNRPKCISFWVSFWKISSGFVKPAIMLLVSLLCSLRTLKE